MQETQVQSLGQEDPLETGIATHSTILAYRIPWTESLVGYCLWGHKELDTTEWLTSIQSILKAQDFLKCQKFRAGYIEE